MVYFVKLSASYGWDTPYALEFVLAIATAALTLICVFASSIVEWIKPDAVSFTSL